MYPAKFDYHRASTMDDVFKLLGEHSDAKLMAGGHSLIPMMKLRLAQPEVVIDIAKLDELRGISEESGRIRVGALTTHEELASSPLLGSKCALLAQAAREIGDVQVRSKGTVGGNIAHADPGSDLPAVLLATSAQVELRSGTGVRTVEASKFFVDLLTTDLREDELVTAVTLPSLDGCGCSYKKFEHPASGYAVVGAAAWLRMEGDVCRGGGLAINGVTVTPYDGASIIHALTDSSASDEAIAAAVEAIRPTDPMADVFASGEYREHLARVYAKRALMAAR